MTNETLRGRVAEAIYNERDRLERAAFQRGYDVDPGPGHPFPPPNPEPILNIASAALAAIGLDDWEAAVERAAKEWETDWDSYSPHTRTDALADAGRALEAALTQPTDPVIPSSAERESRG